MPLWSGRATFVLLCHLLGTVVAVSEMYHFEVKDKGRVVLPAALRSKWGFDVGSQLVARPLGPGQIVVETTDAVLERIWSGLPSDDADAVADLRATRDAQAALLEARAAEPYVAPAIEDASARRAATLLAALGLD